MTQVTGLSSGALGSESLGCIQAWWWAGPGVGGVPLRKPSVSSTFVAFCTFRANLSCEDIKACL